MRIPPVVSLILGLASVPSVAAASHLLRADGSGDFPTIQAAIDASAVGDTILLEDGVYVGDGNRDIHLPGWDLVLRSLSGVPERCTLDAQGSEMEEHNVISVDSGAGPGSRIEGLTVRGGFYNIDASGHFGAGLMIDWSSSPSVANCVFTGNTAYRGAGVACFASASAFTDCRFADNDARYYGGAAAVWYGSNPSFTRCIFTNNAGDAVNCFAGSSPLFSDCLFDHSSSQNGTVLGCWSDCHPVMERCTLADNYQYYGSPINLYASSTLTLRRTIIAVNPIAFPVRCMDESCSVEAFCSDLYGRAGGSWVGCLAGQLGVNGNFEEDPLFTDPGDRDYTVGYGSPCADAPTCGRVGAFGPVFRIRTITDIPGDQGREVRVRWQRARDDAAGSDTVVTSYELWRRVDAGLRQARALHPAGVRSGRGYPPGEWEYVSSVPAHCQTAYATVSPTLCDSTIFGGACWSAFFVRAATPVPSVYIDTPPDSGYSVDNLAPAPPTNPRFEQPTLLAWDASVDLDFDCFTVYGSDSPTFDGTAVMIAHTSSTTLEVADHPYNFYHLTCTDFAGNEGRAASIENSASQVNDAQALPRAFALAPCRPNPASGQVEFAFDLPVATPVRLVLVDVSGRLVAPLVDRPFPLGHHSLLWNGKDGLGAPVAAGVYFYRLEADGFRETRRLLIVR
jgi:hypothetical protein